MNRFASHDTKWSILFAVLCWKLLSHRNHVLFDEDFVVREDIIEASIRYAQELIHAHLRPSSRATPLAADQDVAVKWRVPRRSGARRDGNVIVIVILEFLMRDWKVVLSHVRRKFTVVSNKLATTMCDQPFDNVLFGNQPNVLRDIVLMEESTGSIFHVDPGG
ncbi:hypothetical protein V6N13_064788 [Hibiscus sabdariffa]